MTTDTPKPDTDDDYEAQRKELIQDAKETKQEHEAKQSEMLDAVAQGDDGIDVEDYETVIVGKVEVTAKAYMPGESLNTIERAQRLAKRENVDAAIESIATMTEAMTVVTERLKHTETGAVIESDGNIREFWQGMFEKWGVDGYQQAAMTVLEPATEDMEEKAEAAESFRGH